MLSSKLREATIVTSYTVQVTLCKLHCTVYKHADRGSCFNINVYPWRSIEWRCRWVLWKALNNTLYTQSPVECPLTPDEFLDHLANETEAIGMCCMHFSKNAADNSGPLYFQSTGYCRKHGHIAVSFSIAKPPQISSSMRADVFCDTKQGRWTNALFH